ncbi:hypothetical protein GCM10022221_07370 [Actinocorallia aurea]
MLPGNARLREILTARTVKTPAQAPQDGTGANEARGLRYTAQSPCPAFAGTVCRPRSETGQVTADLRRASRPPLPRGRGRA